MRPGVVAAMSFVMMEEEKEPGVRQQSEGPAIYASVDSLLLGRQIPLTDQRGQHKSYQRPRRFVCVFLRG